MHPDAEEPMLAPAAAMKDVDVRRRLVRMGLPRLNLMVLRVPTAGRDKLVLLQRIDVVLLQEAFGQIGHLDTRTRWNLRLGQLCALGKIAVPPDPALRSNALGFGFLVCERDGSERVGLHAAMRVVSIYARVQKVAPKSSVMVSPEATVKVEP